MFFYTIAILALLFFASYLIGIVNITLPDVKFAKPSPDLTVAKMQTLCGLEKYETIALFSLKYDDRTYSRITKDDFNGITDYPILAKGLCYKLDTGRKVERKKVSSSVWEYRYYAGILFDSNQVYSIVFFDGDWRFVMER